MGWTEPGGDESDESGNSVMPVTPVSWNVDARIALSVRSGAARTRRGEAGWESNLADVVWQHGWSCAIAAPQSDVISAQQAISAALISACAMQVTDSVATNISTRAVPIARVRRLSRRCIDSIVSAR